MSTSLKRKASNGPIGGSDTKKAKANSSITSFFGQPRTAPVPSAAAVKTPATSIATAAAAVAAASTAADPPTFKFNKEKWVEGLTPEQKELLQLEIDTLDPSWLALLKDDITTREFLDLKRFLKKELSGNKKIFPPQEDVYSWSRHTPFHNVRVVILGQDPYHNVNQAHGLAFSVRPPTTAPPSLKNMYKALARDYPAFRPPPQGAGLLTPWADRGVLMLNTCLTVREHDANSHANHGWERFTQRVIDLVATRRTRGVVFMAWGTPAGKRVVKVDAKRHLVLRSVHPSPLSAMRGYLDCGHYKKANEWLVTRYGEDGFIDWSLTEGVSLKPGSEEEEAKKKEDEEEAKKKEEEEKAKVEAAAKAARANAATDEFDDIDIDSDLENAVREAEQMGLASAKKATAPSVVSAMALDTSPLRKGDAAAVKVNIDPLGDDDTEPEDGDDEDDTENHPINAVSASAEKENPKIMMHHDVDAGSGSTTEEEDAGGDDDEKEDQHMHQLHKYNHNRADYDDDDDEGSETETEMDLKDNDTNISNSNNYDDNDDDDDDDDYERVMNAAQFSFTTY